MIQVKRTFQPLILKDVCQIYKLLHEHKFVSFALNLESESKIDAIITNINGSNFDVENYKTIEEKSVAYLFFIIKDHPFIDGNKRTSVLVFKVICALNNISPDPEIPLDALAVYIEEHKDKDHHVFIKALATFLFDKKS